MCNIAYRLGAARRTAHQDANATLLSFLLAEVVSPAVVVQVYQEVVRGGVGSAAAQELFHTQYHKREKSVTAALGDW